MTELILFNYSGYGQGVNTYTEVNAQSGHQILSDIPSSFSVSCGYNKGTAKTFESNPVTVLMTDSGSDGIVIREYGNGKIMGMSQHQQDYIFIRYKQGSLGRLRRWFC